MTSQTELLRDHKVVLLPAASLWYTTGYNVENILANEFQEGVDEDDEGPKMKDIMLECLKKGCGYFCVLDCCWLWIRTAQFFSWFVFDPFTELFITLCIAVNVVFMAADHYSVEYDGM